MENLVKLTLEKVTLTGDCQIPKAASGLVLFAHGSGSSRLSPRNNYVARALNQSGLATLLFDLLTEEEDSIDQYTREYRFNIPLLAERLAQVTDWVLNQPQINQLPQGYFGASTGAAAALMAAAKKQEIKAVISRGGRPDLAGAALPHVQAATLMIVGGLDFEVIELNRQAQSQLRCENKLEIVPGATHLFEEPGTLEQVTTLAKNWFNAFLNNSSSR
jgi:putative phosphoribosyl transferase